MTVNELNNFYDSSFVTRSSLEYTGDVTRTLNFIRLNITEDITNINIGDIVNFNNVNLVIRLNFNNNELANVTFNGTAKVVDKNINGNSLGLEFISGNPSFNLGSSIQVNDILNSSYASGNISVDISLRIPAPAPVAPPPAQSTTIEPSTTNIIAGNKNATFTGDGGNALSASLNKPFGIVYDSSRNLYIADSINQRIRKISQDGIINTIAGNGSQGYSGDNGDALLASFNYPTDLQIKDNNLYILDTNNNAIRLLDLNTNIISTFINNSSNPTPDLFQPQSMCFDVTKSFLYVANTFRNKIIKIDINTKFISNIAGDGTSGFLDNIISTSCKLNSPYGVAVDSYNNIYIADTRNNRIRYINSTNNKIYTIAGTGTIGFSGDNGLPLNAKLFNPIYLIVDNNYNIIFSDSRNNRIRKIFINGSPNISLELNPEVTDADRAQFYDVNGNFNRNPWGTIVYWNYWGPGRSASITDKKAWLSIAANLPYFDLINDPGDWGKKDINAYKAAQLALELQSLNIYFNIVTIAGTGAISYTPDNLDARNTSINNPTKLLFDNNNLIFSDTNNNVIRKISPVTIGGRRKYKKKTLHTRKNKSKSNQKKSQKLNQKKFQ